MKEKLDRHKKTDVIKMVIFSAAGAALIGAGVGAAVSSGLGADALGMLWEGLSGRIGITVGQASWLVVAVCLAAVYFLDRKQLGMSTVVNLFVTGIFADIAIALIRPGEALWMKAALLLGGIALIGIGAGISAVTDTGKDAYNALVLALHKRFHIPVVLSRSGLDLLCFIAGLLLGAGWKIGPVIGICFSG